MNKNTKEKICAFYASDYHFEMMSLPYIDKNMGQDEIIILTENNLEETVKNVLEKINLQENKKEQILNLNWKNNQQEKLENIKKKIENKKDVIIFIKGKQSYIQKTNQEIKPWIAEEQGIKIIDCYEIEEVGEQIDKIMKPYHKVLKTTGEKEIEKL